MLDITDLCIEFSIGDTRSVKETFTRIERLWLVKSLTDYLPKTGVISKADSKELDKTIKALKQVKTHLERIENNPFEVCVERGYQDFYDKHCSIDEILDDFISYRETVAIPSRGAKTETIKRDIVFSLVDLYERVTGKNAGTSSDNRYKSESQKFCEASLIVLKPYGISESTVRNLIQEFINENKRVI